MSSSDQRTFHSNFTLGQWRIFPSISHHFKFSKIACIFLIILAPSFALADAKVIGYMPTFSNLTATIDATDLTKLSHINIAFLNPDSNGALINNDTMLCMEGSATLANDLRYVVNKAHLAGVKVLVSIAGGVIPTCSGNWTTLLQSSNRENLVNNLIKYIDDFNMDGIDIDIEGELLTKIDNANNYTPFVESLSSKLKAREKLLSCATASYVGGMIPVSSIQYFDYVNIMSYDAIGPSWGTPGVEHSTYNQAVADVDLWKKRGLSQDKLVLGVPFYGYGFGTYAQNYTFKQIITQFGADATNKDLIGTACAGCNYITYNGAVTIKAKTRLALQNGAGVMIWELSQDAAATDSLLNAIDQEIKQVANSSAPSSSASSISTSSTVATSAPAKSSSGGSGGVGILDALLLMLCSIFLTKK